MAATMRPDLNDYLLEFSMPEPNSGCWLWLGATNGQRPEYGRVVVDGKQRQAHRLAHALWVGDVADHEVVRHKCDNGLCVNPDHLCKGSHADNVRDRDERGRHVACPGERNGGARLTDVDVLAIRAAVDRGETHRDVAERYGVARSTVTYVVSQGWKHLSQPKGRTPNHAQ